MVESQGRNDESNNHYSIPRMESGLTQSPSNVEDANETQRAQAERKESNTGRKTNNRHTSRRNPP